MIRTLRRTLLLVLLGLLAACGNATPAAQLAPTVAPIDAQPATPSAPTAAPTIARAAATAAPAATARAPEAIPAPQATIAGGAIPDGLTPEGYHFLGRADAPATLVMYSDFL
jgi:hypothetical protein